jgi:HSP20 family protein
MTNTDLTKQNGNGTVAEHRDTALTDQTNQTNSNLPMKREDAFGLRMPSGFENPVEWMRRWDQMFDRYFNRAFGSAFPTEWTGGTERWSNFTPAVNITDINTEYRVTAELPGMDEKDIELTLHRDHLTIKGEKKQEHEDKGQGYYRMERSYGTFQRTLPLPEGIDLDKAEANFSKGLLTVTLPKLPEAQTGARRITIKGENK